MAVTVKDMLSLRMRLAYINSEAAKQVSPCTYYALTMCLRCACDVLAMCMCLPHVHVLAPCPCACPMSMCLPHVHVPAMSVLSLPRHPAYFPTASPCQAIPRVAELMAQHLKWSKKEKSRQVKLAEDYLGQFGGPVSDKKGAKLRQVCIHVYMHTKVYMQGIEYMQAIDAYQAEAGTADTKGDCYLLLATCYLPLTTHHPPLTTHHPPPTTHHLLPLCRPPPPICTRSSPSRTRPCRASSTPSSSTRPPSR